MAAIPLHLLLLLLFQHLFLLLSQLRMILVELSLAFLLSRWHVNDNLIVIFETFRLYLLEGKFNQLLGHRQVFLFHECLILQIELHVVDFVQGLLRSFTLPDIRDQVTNNIFHSLIPDVSLASEFLPQCLLHLTKLHLVMIIAFLEGCSRICIIRIGVFPEFANETHSLPLVST